MSIGRSLTDLHVSSGLINVSNSGSKVAVGSHRQHGLHQEGHLHSHNAQRVCVCVCVCRVGFLVLSVKALTRTQGLHTISCNPQGASNACVAGPSGGTAPPRC